MNYKRNFLSFILFLLTLSLFSQSGNIESKIGQLVKSKKADVGFAMLGIEDADSSMFNGNLHYTMQSVFKFHLALSLLKQVDNGKLKLDENIFVKKSDLSPNTWSPLRDKYPNGNVNLTLADIISYTVSQSDNNGCDLLFKLVGGVDTVNNFIHQNGVNEISIAATEEQMRQSWEIQYKNWTTPWGTVQLLKKFYQKKIISESSTKFLYKVMVETTTGSNRLKSGLPKEAEIAHKTGSSGQNDKGVTAAYNDIGIVALPNGKHYAIAVFITNSNEEDGSQANIIAQISKIVWDYYIEKSKK